jgi:hypothetical protein
MICGGGYYGEVNVEPENAVRLDLFQPAYNK